MKIVAIIDCDGIIHRAEWNRTFADAKIKLDGLIEYIIDAVFADEVLIAVKGEDNFRKVLCTDYKKHRNRSIDLDHRLSALIQHVIDTRDAHKSDGWEADDQCHKWHREILDDKKDLPVICSGDKDMLTIEGVHYNIKEDRIIHIDANTADYNLHKQLLMGDASDNIKGIPKVGPVKAIAALEGVPFGGRRQIIIDEYKKYFDSDWEKELLLTGNLIYIRHTVDVGFEI